MNELATILTRVKEIVTDVLQIDPVAAQELTDETPFFGTEEAPGVIQDSLAILEIASQLAGEFGVLPSDLNEASFQNIRVLSTMIYQKVNENQFSTAS